MVLQQEKDPHYLDTSDQEKQANALFALGFVGFGEVVGGIVEGLVIDKFGNATAIILNIVILIAAIFDSYLNIRHLEFGTQSYVVSGLWGLVDATLNIFIFRTLGFEFESKSIPFGSFNIIQGLSVFLNSVLLS